ncbi:Pr6Pr family membrane protein [Erythrobacter sp. NE805]|uniref:Pr6Pr family membrane protein n=1 Tax=Erythrobacter sp. NE805 TaxID=3389875 RepID=UPI00396B1B91
MNRDTGLRLAAVAIAVTAWTAEVLFVAEQVGDGGALGAVLIDTTAFLTDWTATAVAITCSIMALRGIGAVPPFWRAAAAMGTVTVGILFAGIGGLEVVFMQGTSSVLAHLAVPVAMGLFWLALPRGGLRWPQAAALAGLMVLYLAVMFVRGAASGFYPYPFMDAGAIGYGPSLAFAGVMVATALAVALALVGIDRWRAQSPTGVDE